MEGQLVIVGAGALGCLFASRLSAGGTRLTILDTWAEGVQAIRQHGIRVSAGEHSQVYPAAATTRPEEIQDARWGLVLVKSWQTQSAAGLLQACLRPHSRVLTLQNGLGNDTLLAQSLPGHTVRAGMCSLGATLLSPGHIRFGGEGDVLVDDSDWAELLQGAGLSARCTPELESYRWAKLIANAAINPVTALLGITNGQLAESAYAWQVARRAAEEAAQVAYALGVRLPFEHPEEYVRNIAQRTAANRSSMLQDVQRGAPTEIDAITGAVLHLGLQHNVPVPTHQTLYELIQAVVASHRDDRG
ncbi:MAG: 2-dehydropantoate 2-reductase [Chloroflexi bacterium]|nr:2-dehydropantoate 2-reductase [Chloroflexota bacterium]